MKADPKELAERARANAEKQHAQDMALATGIFDGERFRVGHLILGWPTLFTLALMEENGNLLQALTESKISYMDACLMAAIWELSTSEEGRAKLGGTREERAHVLMARAQDIASEVPIHQATKFVSQLVVALAQAVSGPSELQGGESNKPFPPSTDGGPHSQDTENETE